MVNRISTILLAGYMLLAMGGLSVFYHFCTCTNTIIASLMVEESCCDTPPSQSGCCGTSDTNSCHPDSEQDCDCNTVVKIFRVDNASTTLSNTIIVQDVSLLEVFAILFTNKFFASEQEFNVIPPSYTSPPIAGKELVIAFHAIKIPENIS